MDLNSQTLATQIAPPNLGMINQMVNLATQSQQLQQAQVATQQAQYTLRDQNALQNWMSNPDNFQTNGTIDMSKINEAVPKIAPYLAPDILNHFSTLSNNETQANQAKQNLTQTQRGVIGGVLGVLGRTGIQDPQAYINELGTLKSQFPNDQNFGKLIDSYSSTLGLTPQGPSVPQTAVRASQEYLSPAEQQSQLSPQSQLLNTGGQTVPIINQPSVGGYAPSVGVPGSPNQPIANTTPPTAVDTPIVDAQGNMHVMTRSPAGAIVSTEPMPGSAPPGQGGFTTFTPGQQQQISDAQKEVENVRSLGDQVPIQHNINANILRLSQNTSTGPGTQTWKNAIGALVPAYDVANVNNYQELGKYLEKNGISAMQAMGGAPSDARLSAAMAANGSTSFNPQALQEVTRFNDAASTALEGYRTGIDKAVGLASSDYTALPAFKAAWAKNLDLNIYRVQNAIQNGDQGELANIRSRLGPQGMQALTQKYINLKTLSATGQLPQVTAPTQAPTVDQQINSQGTR